MSSLMITNARIVTLDDEDRFFDTGSIYIEDAKIVDVGDLDTEQYEPDRIIDAVKKLGYRAAEPDASRDAHERRKEFIRFAISAFLTMNIMMLSYALYSGFFTEFSRETIYKLSWPAFVMATIVVVYGGFELVKKAWSGLTNAGQESL